MLRKLEKFYGVFALIAFAGGLIPTDLAQGHSSPTVNRLLVLQQLLLFSLLVPAVLFNFHRVMEGFKHSKWIVALYGLVLVSFLWSSEPSFTLRRSVILLATTLFATYVASSFDLDEQADLFGWMVLLCVLGSLFVVAFYPTYGISHDLHSGDWKGLFPHKNSLGMVMSFGLLLLAIARPSGIPAFFRYLGIAGAAILLIMSHSATALMTTTAIFAAYPALHLLRLRKKRAMPLWIALSPLFLVAILAVLINLGPILDLLGKDSTLTGRTPLWQMAVAAIQERPLFGYGYAVFWRGFNGITTLTPISMTTHAHNGYLDLCLDVGFVGLFLFLVGFVYSVFRASSMFLRAETPAEKWPLIFLIFLTAYNLTESNLMRSHAFLWIPYVWVYVSLALRAERAPNAAEEAEMIPQFGV